MVHAWPQDGKALSIWESQKRLKETGPTDYGLDVFPYACIRNRTGKDGVGFLNREHGVVE